MAAPIMIRNTMPGPTVFTDDLTHTKVEWWGYGDPNSRDIQPVPPALLDNVQFRRAMTAGILEQIAEDDAELTSQIELDHRQEWEARQQKAQSASAATIERPQDEDVLVLSCLGPKGKTGELCAEPVAVKSKVRNEKPPLCPKHAPLAGQFISQETGRMVGGQAEVQWSRSIMGARERSQ